MIRHCPYLEPCKDKVKYGWIFNDWTSCSKTCGSDGVQVRTPFCKPLVGESIVNEHFCRDFEKPQAEIRDCLGPTVACYPGTWVSGLWSGCTTSCGEGTKKRAIGCRFNGTNIIKITALGRLRCNR